MPSHTINVIQNCAIIFSCRQNYTFAPDVSMSPSSSTKVYPPCLYFQKTGVEKNKKRVRTNKTVDAGDERPGYRSWRLLEIRRV